jgi:tRNA threonylcarbamoyl adenosine modification protein YeaZ
MDTAGVLRTTCALLTADSWTGATVLQSPAESLAPAIDQLLADGGFSMRDITHIVCGVGPGPFTGLRIGLAHAHAAAHALGVPVSGVSSLAAIAHRIVKAERPDEFLVASDARRKEVYCAVAGSDARLVGAPQVLAPAEFAAAHQDMLVVGDGAQVYADVFRAAGHRIADDALLLSYEQGLADATRDALTMQPLPALPQYLREPDAVPAATIASASSATAFTAQSPMGSP